MVYLCHNKLKTTKDYEQNYEKRGSCHFSADTQRV